MAQHSFIHEMFGTRNGLMSPKVYALAQSANRLLWIGTELGISSFDGKTFTNYQYTIKNTVVGRILAITEDSSHRIWCGGDKGLFIIDQQNVYPVALTAHGSMAVESLLTDAAGNIWVGDINALYKLLPSEQKQLNITGSMAMQKKVFAGFNKRAYCLALDILQQVYVGGFDAVYKLNENSVEEIWQNPRPQEPIRSLAMITADSFFAGQSDDLSFAVVRKRQQYLDIPYLPRFWYRSKNASYLFTSNNLVVANPAASLSLYNYESLVHHVHTGMIDAEGNFWVGSWEGLIKLKRSAFYAYAAFNSKEAEVFSMLEEENGSILLGGNQGKLYRAMNNEIKQATGMPRLFKLAEVMTLVKTADHAIWAGSGYEGISRYHHTLQNWMPAGHLKDNNCEALYPLPGGHLLACTENGAVEIDPYAKEPFIKHYGFAASYSRKPELFGACSWQHKIWVYGSSGLFLMQNDQLVQDSIAGLHTTAVYINKMVTDKKGQLWVASLGKGLLQCVVEDGHIKLLGRYAKANGMSSDHILSVVADDKNRIWTVDYSGISRLEEQDGMYTIHNFNEHDGLLSTYYSNAKLEQQRNGTIWLLSTNGVLSFNPDSLYMNQLPPGLVWQNLEAGERNNNETISLNNSATATLRYNFNNIYFKFNAICLTEPSGIRYAVRLIGLDSSWNIQSNNEIVYRLLPPGQYRFEVKACNNNGVWMQQPLQYNFIIRPPFWQTWWFILLLIISIASLMGWLIHRRLKAIKTKTLVKQQMAELEAKAIRAQMNPHFIFNSLNAIQESIVLQDFDTSYHYLSRFSKLLRMVLELSEKNMILLREEVEMDRLYLELESLRFRRSFTYKIQVSDELDEDEVMFPSILIQPFIENAIWHGLMPKKGEKKVEVGYCLHGNEVQCVIEDNGIGRAAAMEIKQKKIGSGFFASKAIGLVQQRIDLLQQSGTVSARLDIIDKVDEDGNAAGTRVVVTVPLVTSYKQQL